MVEAVRQRWLSRPSRHVRERTAATSGFIGVLLPILLFAPGASLPVHAGETDDFYRGKTITIIVGGDPGGSYDTYARLASRHLPQRIPGNPGFILQYMPGAGSVIATNHVYSAAPQDGTVLLAPNRTTAFAPVVGQQGARFEPAKMNWIASLNNDVGVMQVWGTTAVKSLEDARKTTVIIGATSPMTDSQEYPTLLNNTLGTRFKMVMGYKSMPALQNSLEAGEVQGAENSFIGMEQKFPDWRERLRVLVQLSLSKHSRIPEVPLVFDYIRADLVAPGVSVEEANAIWRIILTQQSVGRPYVAGPNVPADRVKVLRDAFRAAVSDEAFLGDARKGRMEIDFLGGEDIQAMIGSVSSASPAIINKLRDLIVYKGDPSR